MIKGVSFTRGKAVFAATSVAAAAAVLIMRAEIARRIRQEIEQGQFQDGQMVGRVQAASEFDGTHLSGLREKVNRFRGRLGNEDTWGRLLGKLGSDWSLESVSRADRAGYSVQYGTFKMKAPTVSEWQGILETVRFVEGLPGVGIGEFEMRTIGDGLQRSLSVVSMVVVVHSRSTRTR